MQTQAMTVGLYCKQKVVRCRLQEQHVMEEEKRQQRAKKRSVTEQIEGSVEHLENYIMEALKPLRHSPVVSNILQKFTCTVQKLLDLAPCNLFTFYNLESPPPTKFTVHVLCSKKR